MCRTPVYHSPFLRMRRLAGNVVTPVADFKCGIETRVQRALAQMHLSPVTYHVTGAVVVVSEVSMDMPSTEA